MRRFAKWIGRHSHLAGCLSVMGQLVAIGLWVPDHTGWGLAVFYAACIPVIVVGADVVLPMEES